MARFIKFLGLFISIALLFPWSIIVILSTPFFHQSINAAIFVCVCLTMPMTILIAGISYSFVYGGNKTIQIHYEKLIRAILKILFKLSVRHGINILGVRLIRIQLSCPRCGVGKTPWLSMMCADCVKNKNYTKSPTEFDPWEGLLDDEDDT